MRQLLTYSNVNVHILTRKESEQIAKKEIESLSKKMDYSLNNTINYHVVNLSSKKDISSFCEKWNKENSRLDVLINNAALVPQTFGLSVDDEELQFSVNIMSYVRLMQGLLPSLKNSQYINGPKIVNVASQYTQPVDMKNIQWSKDTYNSTSAYKQSKAADRMLSYAASKIYKQYNVNVYSCHPGVTESKLLRGLNGKPFDSADKSAQTPVFLAMNDEVGSKETGLYFVEKTVIPCPFCKNEKKVAELWDYCVQHM